MQQYFIDYEIQDDSVVLNEQQTHHIQNVLRMKEGKQIQLVDLSRQVFSASIVYEEERVIAQIIERIEAYVSPVHVELQACLIKGDRWDFLLQKASELGVDSIRPVQSRYCVVKIDDKDKDKKQLRWQTIVQSACEQSKRHDLVDVLELTSLKELQSDADLKLVAYEALDEVDYSLNMALQDHPEIRSVAICIGPEGGFHPSEIEFLISIGYKCIQLGPRILRAETAAIASVDRIKNYFEGDCYE